MAQTARRKRAKFTSDTYTMPQLAKHWKLPYERMVRVTSTAPSGELHNRDRVRTILLGDKDGSEPVFLPLGGGHREPVLPVLVPLGGGQFLGLDELREWRERLRVKRGGRGSLRQPANTRGESAGGPEARGRSPKAPTRGLAACAGPGERGPKGKMREGGLEPPRLPTRS